MIPFHAEAHRSAGPSEVVRFFAEVKRVRQIDLLGNAVLKLIVNNVLV